MSRRSSFDSVAWFYDPLVRLVFGQSMVQSQTQFLNRIRDGAAVLVLGGGTGWILDEIFARADPAEVCYVETSSKMLEKAKKRRMKGIVRFVSGTWRGLPPEKFDVVITNYFLDLFTDSTLTEVIPSISNLLKDEGIWLATDFTAARWWHRLMLSVMYWFFRVLCRIEARSLPAWEHALTNAGFRSKEHAFHYRGFMKSVLFKR